MLTTTKHSIDISLKEASLVSKLDQLYVQARTRKRRYYEDWRRNYLLVNNKMWSEWRTANWMPAPQDSEIYPIVSALIAWMTDQSVVFSCSAASDPHSLYSQWVNKLANDLESVLQSNWVNHHMDTEENLILWDAAMYGSGILKGIWDPGAVDGLGDAIAKRVDPWLFFPDPNATSMHDMQYCVEVSRLSFDEVQRRFPLTYDKLMANEAFLSNESSNDLDTKPSLYDSDTFPKANAGNLPPSTSSSYGLPGQSRNRAIETPGIIVHEFWIRENRIEDIEDSPQKRKPNPDLDYPDQIITDSWRVVVVASGIVLMDEYADQLWSSGNHPYSRFVYDETGEFWGMNLVTHLAPAQIAINRLLSSLQHNAELIGNPVWLESDDAGLSRTTMVNRPGQRLRMQGGPNASPNNKPGWIPPPNMPPFIQGLIEFWIARMENISGLGSSQKGNLPPARTPSSSVVATQESGFVRIRQGMRNLENCLRDTGNFICQLISENYTEPRVVAIVGESGQQSSLWLASRHFMDPTDEGALPYKFTVLIDAGANNPTSRQSRIAEADTLFAMHAIDQQALLEAHAYPNAAQIVERMRNDALGAFMQQQQSHSRVRSGRTT